MNTLNVQEVGLSDKYICGKYDLEILTLPRIKLQNVEIKQSSTNSIKIPSAGSFGVNKGGLGIGSIYLENGKKLEWVCNLNESLETEVFYLQPGNYRVEFRLKTQPESEKSVEKKFTITSNKLTQLSIF
jgi:Ca-activated chloride channel family protein